MLEETKIFSPYFFGLKIVLAIFRSKNSFRPVCFFRSWGQTPAHYNDDDDDDDDDDEEEEEDEDGVRVFLIFFCCMYKGWRSV